MNKILEYTDEKTFITENIEFSKKYYDVAEKLHSKYSDELGINCSQIMVHSDKKSLMFCIDLGDKIENNENNERYYVNAEKGVTVTFNLVGIDKKLFNDENAEVTRDKENVEISFDKDIKKWKATIKKSDDYTFTFSNNGFVQTVKITKQDRK